MLDILSKMGIGYILFILNTFVISVSQKLPEYVSNECYGNSFNFDCGQGHKIRILKDFYGYSTSNNCIPSPDDCIVPNPNTDSLIHRYCTGKKSCPYFQVERRACNGVYTNYQQVEYQCVPENQVVDMCQVLEYSTSELYLSSPNFPQNYPPGLDCSCFITSDQDTLILLEIIYMSIKHNFPCGDWLKVGRTRMCGMNIDLFSGQQMPLEFHSDNEGGHAGFWLNLKASRPGGQLNVQCRNTTLQALVRRRVFQSRQRSRAQPGRTSSGRISTSGRIDTRMQQRQFSTRGSTGGVMLDNQQSQSPQNRRRMQMIGRSGGTTRRRQSSLNNRGGPAANVPNSRSIATIRQNQQIRRERLRSSRERSSENENDDQFVRQRQPVSNTRDPSVFKTRHQESASNTRTYDTKRSQEQELVKNVRDSSNTRHQQQEINRNIGRNQQQRTISKSRSSETSSDLEQDHTSNKTNHFGHQRNRKQGSTSNSRSSETSSDQVQDRFSNTGRSGPHRIRQQGSPPKSRSPEASRNQEHERITDIRRSGHKKNRQQESYSKSKSSEISRNQEQDHVSNTRHSGERYKHQETEHSNTGMSKEQQRHQNNRDMLERPRNDLFQGTGPSQTNAPVTTNENKELRNPTIKSPQSPAHSKVKETNNKDKSRVVPPDISRYQFPRVSSDKSQEVTPVDQLPPTSNSDKNGNKKDVNQESNLSATANITPSKDFVNFSDITVRPETNYAITQSKPVETKPIETPRNQNIPKGSVIPLRKVNRNKSTLHNPDQLGNHPDSTNGEDVDAKNKTNLFDFEGYFSNEDVNNENDKMYAYQEFFTSITIDSDTSSNSDAQDITNEESSMNSKGKVKPKLVSTTGNKNSKETGKTESSNKKGNIYFKNKQTKSEDNVLQYTTPASFNIERFLKSQLRETSNSGHSTGKNKGGTDNNKELAVEDILTMFTIPSKVNGNKEKVKTSPPQLINLPNMNTDDHIDKSPSENNGQFYNRSVLSNTSDVYNAQNDVHSRKIQTPLLVPTNETETSKPVLDNPDWFTKVQANLKNVHTASDKIDVNLSKNITDSQSYYQEDPLSTDSKDEDVSYHEYDLFHPSPNENRRQYDDNYDVNDKSEEYIGEEFPFTTFQNFDDKSDYPSNTKSVSNTGFLDEYENNSEEEEDIIYDLETTNIGTENDYFGITGNNKNMEDDFEKPVLNEGAYIDFSDESNDYANTDEGKIDVLDSKDSDLTEHSNEKDKDSLFSAKIDRLTNDTKTQVSKNQNIHLQDEGDSLARDINGKSGHNIKKNLDDLDHQSDTDIFNLGDVVHGQHYFGNFADSDYDGENNATMDIYDDGFLGNNTEIDVKPVSELSRDGSVLTIGLIILSVCVAAGLILLICFLVALLCHRRKRRNAVAPRPTLAIIHAKREMLVKQQHDADSGRSLLIHAEQQNHQLSSAESYAKGRGHQSIVDVDSLYAKPHKKDKTVQADMNDGYEEVFITKKPIFTIDSSESDASSLSNFQKPPTPPESKGAKMRNHKAVQAKANLFKAAATDLHNLKNKNISSSSNIAKQNGINNNVMSPMSRKRHANNTNTKNPISKQQSSMHGNYPAKPSIPPKPAFLRAGGRTQSSNGCASNTGNISADTASNVLNELKDTANPKHSLHKKTIASMPGLAEMTFMPENSPVYYEIAEPLSDDDSDWETKSAISL